MNKSKKFMTFVEGIVEDPALLNIIKSGFKVCTESVEYEGGDQWIIEIEEFEYPLEIANKYFNLKEEILKYKRKTGDEDISKDSVTVSGSVTVEFDFNSIPYHAASMEGPEEGGLEVNDTDIIGITLNLDIEGDEVASLDIDDENAISEIDSVLSAAIEKAIDENLDTIMEKSEERYAQVRS